MTEVRRDPECEARSSCRDSSHYDNGAVSKVTFRLQRDRGPEILSVRGRVMEGSRQCLPGDHTQQRPR